MGHNLIMGHVPEKLGPKEINNYLEHHSKPVIQKFGLFDTAAPNFNTFYPSLTAEDLKPKDEDYVYPLVRALSAITLNRYGPIEFPQAALKAATQLLVGQTVYPNHEDSVGNELGVVKEAFWGRSYTTADGIKIPAGINARLAIDGKTNPKIARGVQSNPPAVHSLSVGVNFEWFQSHANLTEEEFYNKLGTYDATGSLIRRIVKSIISFEEISFVKHGQDPYAQILDEDGKINNPRHADIHNTMQNKFSAQDYEKHGTYFDWKASKTDRIKLNRSSAIPTNLNNNHNSTKTMNEELLKFLRKQLGLADTATEAEVQAKLLQLDFIADKAKLTQAEADLQTANTSLTAMKAKYPEGTEILSAETKAELTNLRTEASTRLTNLRAQVLKLYHLSAGGANKAQASITKLIAEGDLATVTALYDQYNALAEKDHKLSCSTCGGTNIKRASSKGAKLGVATTDEETEGESEQFVAKTNGEVLEAIARGKANSSILYGNSKK